MKDFDKYENKLPWKNADHGLRDKYREEDQRLYELFFEDCRKELGYDKWMTPKGVAMLETEAWGRGHANGYSEVWSYLHDLDIFAKAIANDVIAKFQQLI